MKRLLSLLLSLTLILGLLAACDTSQETGTPATTTAATTTPGSTSAGRTVLDPTIDKVLFGGSGSYEALLAGVQSALASGAFNSQGILYKTMTGAAERNGAGADSGMAAAPAAKGSEAAYSTTNIQVAGVDEADIIKTDGRYLYYVANNRLYIVDAEAAKPQVIYTWTFKRNVSDGKKTTNESPLEIYLDPVGKRLTVIIQGYQYEPLVPPSGTVQTKPAETRPAETKPAETRPGEIRPTGSIAVPPVAPDYTTSAQSPASPASGSGSGPAPASSPAIGPAVVAEPQPAVDLPASGVSASKVAPGYILPMNQKSYVVTKVYSVADPKAPRLLRTFSQEGSYLSSRLVDGTAFILTNKYDYRLYQMAAVKASAGVAEGPAAADSAAKSVSGSAGSVGSVASGSVGSVGSANGGKEPATVTKPAATTPATTVPATTAAPKVDAQQFKDSLPKVSDDPDKGNWETLPADRIGIVPQGDPAAQMIVSAIPVANDTLKPATLSLLGASGIVYASKDNIYIANYNYAYNQKKPEDSQTSMKIYRLRITDGKIAADGTGSVPGTAINQFAMDEHNGYFRIATTQSSFMRTQTTTQNTSESTLYVLDKSLKVVGQVGKLGPGETIRSVRFMGDRAYVVTFRTTDPLYVLDLKTPTAPRVLGELKIPGFSTYLHPYGDNQLIGFGYDAVVEGNNAYQTGIKVSLFDSTDVTRPRELSTLIFGGRGSHSALDQSHKALLFSAEKSLIAFPATITSMPGGDKMSYRHVFQGLVVLAIENNKLVLRGGLTNSASLKDPNGPGVPFEKMTPAENQAIYGSDAITRGVMLGDRIVTLSGRLVSQYQLGSLKLAGETALAGYEEYFGVSYGVRDSVPMPAAR